MNIARQVRADTLPEGARYTDDGCKYAPSCLNCPFPVCRDEDGHASRAERNYERDTEIFRLRKQGVPPVELARQFKISSRSVQRIIQRGGPSERSTQLELDDIQGKPVSAIGSPIHAPAPLPVMRENARRAI